MNQQCLSDVDQMTTELQKLKSEKSTCEKIKLDWQTKASELENVSRDLQKDITVLTTTSRNLRQQNENLERLYNEKNITFSELKSKKESLELRLVSLTCFLFFFFNQKYNRTSMTRTSVEPWKLFLDMGSSSHWGLIITPGQKVNRNS